MCLIFFFYYHLTTVLGCDTERGSTDKTKPLNVCNSLFQRQHLGQRINWAGAQPGLSSHPRWWFTLDHQVRSLQTLGRWPASRDRRAWNISNRRLPQGFRGTVSSRRWKWGSAEKGGINLKSSSTLDIPKLYPQWHTKHSEVESIMAQGLKFPMTSTVPVDVDTQQTKLADHLLQRILVQVQRIFRSSKKHGDREDLRAFTDHLHLYIFCVYDKRSLFTNPFLTSGPIL